MIVGERGKLSDFLRTREGAALKLLDGVDADVLLSENEDVLVLELMSRALPDPVAVRWSEPSRSQIIETTKEVYDEFERRIQSVAASSLDIRYPVDGSAELFEFKSSVTFFGAEHVGRVEDGHLLLVIVEPQLTPELLERQIKGFRDYFTRMEGWLNDELGRHRESLNGRLRERLSERKTRVLNDRSIQASLGIPVRETSSAPPAVSANRKQVSLQRRREQAAFVPEHVLDEVHYQDILRQVSSWGTALERVPKTATKFDEEGLRDQLLVMLNASWEGQAGGELFNGAGKTDILIRHENRNVFVAECKIWRGPQSATDAVDQLLSYLVWRDSKAALIFFIKTSDPKAAIKKLYERVAAHPRCVLSHGRTGDVDARRDFVMTADEEARRVSLAVIPVVVGP